MGWPKEDRIRWVEWRLKERIAKESGRYADRDLSAEGVPDRISLEVWLAKERDGLSWQQIVIKYFPQYVGRRQKSAGMSKARRVHGLVKAVLSPTEERDRFEHAHQIIRYEFYVECSCGYKGHSRNHACRKCGAQIDFGFGRVCR